MKSHAHELKRLKVDWEAAPPGPEKDLALQRYKAGLELAGVVAEQVEEKYVETAADALK
jgi:hypothetical protein